MTILKPWVFAVAIVAVLACPAGAHFQILVPGSEFAGPDSRDVDLDILFTHPMEGGPVMEMGSPAAFGVLVAGARTDLLPTLEKRTLQGKTAYHAVYRVRRPGDHVFYLEPAPYWEPAERRMIIHYTKVVVDAFGEEEGWDALVGFPVEIRPLTRPYGLWTGNVFRGVVLKNGEPVPFAEVEIEFWNRDGSVTPPDDAFVTQVVRTDANGVFAYAMPRAGWWGFAALVDGDEPMKNPDGDDVDVELGGLLWVRCRDMK